MDLSRDLPHSRSELHHRGGLGVFSTTKWMLCFLLIQCGLYISSVNNSLVIRWWIVVPSLPHPFSQPPSFIINFLPIWKFVSPTFSSHPHPFTSHLLLKLSASAILDIFCYVLIFWNFVSVCLVLYVGNNPVYIGIDSNKIMVLFCLLLMLTYHEVTE